MKKLLLLLLIPCSIAYATPAKKQADKSFKSTIHSLPVSIQKQMKKYTWHPGCPISLNDLAYIRLTYWGFDHKPHQGELIVHKTLAPDIVEFFHNLYLHQFPIQRMELMDKFRGNDDAAMAANNTSSFNCRAVTGKPGLFSQHSYGSAIDINTLINPYVKGKTVLPPNGIAFADRTKPHQGKITKNSIVYKEFIKHGWTWGGNWKDLKDYQHFEKKLAGTN